MLVRVFFLFIFGFSSLLHAAGQNFLGDTLSQGEQFVSTTVSMSDWYAGGDYVDDATVDAIDDLQRGFTNANHKGYDFKTFLTYAYGVTQDISIGFKYGYTYQKDEASIGSNEGAGFEGEWVSEGGSDFTLLGAYRLDESSAINVFIDFPICSSPDVKSLCSSKLATLDNSTQVGTSGGQGKGFYRMGSAVSSNWITDVGTHWMGSLFVSAALSDKVAGQKVSAPFTYGGTFGAVMPIKQNHAWTGSLTLSRMLGFSGYSSQAQVKTTFGDHSSLALKGEYLWDFMGSLQLRPFLSLAMVQAPAHTFYSGGQRRMIEYTSGTNVTLGTELRATF